MAMTQEDIEVMLEYAAFPQAEKDELAEAYWAAEDELRRAPCCPQCGETDHLEPGVPCGPDYAPEAEVRQAKPRREVDPAYSHRRETASAACRVDAIDPGRWEVHSPSGKTYVVLERADGQMVCECPAWKFNRQKSPEPCKHIAAVVLAREDPARLVEAIRTDLLAETPDIAHALALVERLGARARARA